VSDPDGALPASATAWADPDLRRWLAAAVVALAAAVLAVPGSLLLRSPGRSPEPARPRATFVGTAACARCHQAELEAWRGSDHDRAMEEATESTVLGDFAGATFTHAGVTSRFFRRNGRFVVHTEGVGGKMSDFEVAYTYGYDPLQQYLVRFPGGRLQALPLAWDEPGQRWFHLYPDQDIPPDDWLHWTRNAQNWNGMCAECHSTDLRKGYDPATDTYTTTWSDVDVGCEACHGPGSDHVAWADLEPMARPELPDAGLLVRTRDLEGPQLVELCAPCHSRRAELGDYDHTGARLLDHMLPSLLVEGLYHPDGQILDEVYVYGSFLQSKMYQRGVTCRDCHDVHRLGLLRQGNDLCLQCHQREVYDTGDHHFHKLVVEGSPSDGALCVKCHMAEQPYMVVDWRADHSFRRPRPDLTAAIGTPNACSQGGCHDDRPLSWVLDAARRWYGQARRPHYGTTLAAGRAGAPEALPELLRLARDPLQPAIVRSTALDLLGRHSGPDSTAALREAIFDPDPLIRRTGVATLVVADPTERAGMLAPLLSDPVRAVRLAAVGALAGVPLELLKPYQRDAFAAAVEEYRQAMAYSLDFASSGFNLGNLDASLGNLADAERSYRQALAVDDLFFPAAVNLAVLLSRQGRNDEAGTLLEGVVAHYPDNADAASMLGLLRAEQGRPEEAVELLRKAAEGMPRNARVRYNLGLLLAGLGRDAEAEAALRRSVELDPSSLDALHALADFYLRRGRLDEARAAAGRMVATAPDNPLGHQLLAMVDRAAR